MSHPQILIVDDEPELLRLFESLIRRLDGHPLLAPGGEAALKILARETPDLMVLDLAMPNVSGVEVLRQVRQIPRLAHMKVVVLTARSSMVPEAEQLGIDLWVAKPVQLRDFMDVIVEMLAPAT